MVKVTDINNLFIETENNEFNEKRNQLLNEVIDKSVDMFLQTFDKGQLDGLYEKFKELNKEAVELNVSFLDKNTRPGIFIHNVLKALIRNDHYGKNVV